MIEKMARALVNRRKPKPEVGGLDAFDLLKHWAEFDPSTAEPGTIGYRAHPDNFAAAKRELEEAMADARAALDALEEAGYVVVPREPTHAMTQAGGSVAMNKHDAPPWCVGDVYQAMIRRAKGE